MASNYDSANPAAAALGNRRFGVNFFLGTQGNQVGGAGGALSNTIAFNGFAGVQVLHNAATGTNFTLDFYASPAADPSGYGEGKRYLGSKTVSGFSATGESAGRSVVPACAGNDRFEEADSSSGSRDRPPPFLRLARRRA